MGLILKMIVSLIKVGNIMHVYLIRFSLNRSLVLVKSYFIVYFESDPNMDASSMRLLACIKLR